MKGKKKNSKELKEIATIDFPTKYGGFVMTTYQTTYKTQPFMKFVLVLKTKQVPAIPLIRVHSSCILSETFGSAHCDCSEQLVMSIKMVGEKGGMVFYLDQEGRGHGLLDKVLELRLQQKFGLDTVEASEHLNLVVDQRSYEVVADILSLMGITKIKAITNNPKKISELLKRNIKVIERIPLEVPPNKNSLKYLKTKKTKLGHLLDKYV